MATSPRVVAVLASTLTALVAACSGGSAGSAASPGLSPGSSSSVPAAEPSAGTASATPSPQPSPQPSTEPSSGSPTTTAAGSPAPSRVVGTEVVAGHLDVPWDLLRLPDGSHLVSLRDEARVVHVARSGQVTPVPATGEDGSVPGVEPDGEGGLLGLALDPDDGTALYAYLTADDDNRVVRMRYAAGRLGPPTVVLSGLPKAAVHNGGRMAFGPDGFLYVCTGDATDRGRSQDRGYLGGKILRVTRDGAPAPGNPFAGSPVWTLGHRNVQGIGWDAAGRMFASEFGQNTWDELNQIVPGRNYGWPEVEGPGTDDDRDRGFTRPLASWPTDEASPSGLAVGLGAVWLAALRGERLWRVPLGADGRTGSPQALLTGELGRLRDVDVEPDGTLLVLTSNTFRGRPTADDDRLVRVRLG
jgi:glucose/arabinose dehydrogenase